MEKSLAHQLSDILYALEQQNANLNIFFAKNKTELIEKGMYDTVNDGFNQIEVGLQTISKLF